MNACYFVAKPLIINGVEPQPPEGASSHLVWIAAGGKVKKTSIWDYSGCSLLCEFIWLSRKKRNLVQGDVVY